MMALTLYEDGLCNGCGQPIVEAHNPDSVGHYVAATDIVCNACAAIEETHDRQQKAKDRARGQKTRVGLVLLEGQRLAPYQHPGPLQHHLDVGVPDYDDEPEAD